MERGELNTESVIVTDSEVNLFAGWFTERRDTSGHYPPAAAV